MEPPAHMFRWTTPANGNKPTPASGTWTRSDVLELQVVPGGTTILGKPPGLSSYQIVNKGEDALIHYPLEMKCLMSCAIADIGMMIYYVDEVLVPLNEGLSC